MPIEAFQALDDHLEFVSLPSQTAVYEPSDPADHIYFLESGVASRIVTGPSGSQVEGGLCGPEGLFPTECVLDADTVVDRVVMQIGGNGWRAPTAAFTRVMHKSIGLQTLLQHFVATLMAQTRHTAASNAVNPVDVRLARWLLMCSDRVQGPTLELTQEFISFMLGVRRPTVTESLRFLESKGLARPERGRVVILDRVGLERLAGEAYGAPEALYRELIGPLPSDAPQWWDVAPGMKVLAQP